LGKVRRGDTESIGRSNIIVIPDLIGDLCEASGNDKEEIYEKRCFRSKNR